MAFLIADVRGYSRFTSERGDEAAAALAQRFAKICEDVVGKHYGRVTELRGDEALCVFPSIRNSLRAALELRVAFERSVAADPSLPLRVGMGLAVGEAVAVAGGYRGGSLNLAARLCSIARAGEILAGESIRLLVGKVDGISFIDRGAVALKGFSQPIRVMQIVAEGEQGKEYPPLRAPATPSVNLPNQPTPFIGRKREIEELLDLFRSSRVRMVTLTGLGGTGKTRLALEVAANLMDDFPDSLYFVPLAPLGDPTLVLTAIAASVGVKESGTTDLLDSLVERLQTTRVLLLLDTFEHLMQACPVVAALLDSCAEMHIMVTSRSPLHLSREQEYPVPPMALPDATHLGNPQTLARFDAVGLFVQRAQAVVPGFRITKENAPAIASICHRLDGLPLAIELAASRIKLFPPQPLLEQLSSGMRLLAGGARDRPQRQQTLRATFDWSYRLLSSQEQVVFARFSVFIGGCTVHAAEAICSTHDLDLLDILASLVDKSLVRQEGEADVRFSMLATIREYADERLAAQGAADEIRALHAAYYLDLALAAELDLRGPSQADWLRRLHEEIDNLRAALSWLLQRGRIEDEIRLVTALDHFWFVNSAWNEARGWLEAGLHPDNALAPSVRAKGLRRLGEIFWRQGELERAARLEEEALLLFRELGDWRSAAGALNYLGMILSDQGDSYRSDALLHEGLELARQVGAPHETAGALFGLASLASLAGNHAAAQQRLEEALGIGRASGDTRLTAHVLTNLGVALVQQGLLAEASNRFEAALVLAQDLGAPVSIALALQGLGRVAVKQGEYARAAAQFQESLRLGREVGSKSLTLGVLGDLAQLAVETGNFEQASRLGGAEAALRQTTGLLAPQFERSSVDEALARARREVSNDAWRRAWSEGQVMTLEEAVGYAAHVTV